jgi:hypothetical protein
MRWALHVACMGTTQNACMIHMEDLGYRRLQAREMLQINIKIICIDDLMIKIVHNRIRIIYIF